DRLGWGLIIGLGLGLIFSLIMVVYRLVGARTIPVQVVLGNALIFVLLGLSIVGLFGGDNEAQIGASGGFWRIARNTLLGWLVVGLVGALVIGPGAGLVFGWIGGLVGGLAGRVDVRPRRIVVVEFLRWSWPKTVRSVPTAVVAGTAVGLLNAQF